MPDIKLVNMLSGSQIAGQGGLTPAWRHLKLMPAVLRCMFGLSASDIKAYVLNRHLKTLAGMNFRLTRHAGVKPLLLLRRTVITSYIAR